MHVNLVRFMEIQGKETDSNMCLKLGISRTQLWRAKKGGRIGEKFISCFKRSYPELILDEYFF